MKLKFMQLNWVGKLLGSMGFGKMQAQLQLLLREIASLEVVIMSTREELIAKLDQLDDAAVAERAQVVSAIGELKAAIAALEAKIVALESAQDYSSEIARVDAALGAVEGIYEPEVPEVAEPVTEPLPGDVVFTDEDGDLNEF